jgi:hypothetical protein
MDLKEIAHIDDDVALYMPHPAPDPLPLIPHSTIRCAENDYYAMFRMLDLDRVGSFHLQGGDLSEPEIEIVLRKFGLHDAQLEKFFALVQADEDGCITFADFMAVMKECNKELPIRLIERLFLIFEDPTSCWLAQAVSIFTTALIFISTAAFVVESLPIFKLQPVDCDGLVVSCRPLMTDEIQLTFSVIEAFCVIGFTVDYVGKPKFHAESIPF